MDNQRIQAVTDAAALLFLQQGYSKTQISHIAKAAGVSVGTIYLDFAGKKEIMHLVLKSVIDPSFLYREFKRPITDDLFLGIEDEIMALFAQTQEAFKGHLDQTGGPYGLKDLVSDAFDMLARYAVGCLFIEKNEFEFPVLSGHYKVFRKKFFETMCRYLQGFIAGGTVRPLKHPELSTVLMIETLTWWAMDRRYTSFETMDIPLEMAKEVCLDNIIAAYGR